MSAPPRSIAPLAQQERAPLAFGAQAQTAPVRATSAVTPGNVALRAAAAGPPVVIATAAPVREVAVAAPETATTLVREQSAPLPPPRQISTSSLRPFAPMPGTGPLGAAEAARPAPLPALLAPPRQTSAVPAPATAMKTAFNIPVPPASRRAQPPEPPKPAPAPSIDEKQARALYIESLVRALGKYKRYAAVAQERGQQGTATVRVKLRGDGRAETIEIDRSSGHSSLDREALSMMRKALPFAERRPILVGRSFEFKVKIEFTLER
jgi:protein TonB